MNVHFYLHFTIINNNHNHSGHVHVMILKIVCCYGRAMEPCENIIGYAIIYHYGNGLYWHAKCLEVFIY